MSDTTIMIKSPYAYAQSLSDWAPFVNRSTAKRDTFIFEIRAAHIALLQEASWEWDDNFSPGAPLVDAKRPFGNSMRTSIASDIYRIVDDSDVETLSRLGMEAEYTDDNVDTLLGMWSECALVLSIMFECAKQGVVCAAGSKWQVSRDETWRKVG